MTQAKDLLQKHFGFSDFRPGQEQVIETLLQGRSALAVFPTGSGKSLCFQLPALALGGVTLVVSPLLALMKDQVDFLVSKGIAAARWDSSLNFEQIRQIRQDVQTGKIKILYVSPERLSNEFFLNFMIQVKISLMVIDEAHCISEWGHNFRPEYLKLRHHAQPLGIERFLCLTATATPPVAQDICAQFSIAPSDYVLTGFFRPNLEIRHSVLPGGDEQKKQLLLKRLADAPKGATIVYVALRQTAEQISGFLSRNGHPSKAFHAGLKTEEREKIQQWFMGSPEGIVVATIAFGMGVDKSDIRYVYHYNLPKNLESYSQEIGRAGRDGQPSVCEVLAAPADGAILENFVYGDTPDSDDLSRVIKYLFDQEPTFSLATNQLSVDFDINGLALGTLLVYLELGGYLKYVRTLFTSLQYKLLVTEAEILERFNDNRAGFLRKIFDAAEKKKTWAYVFPKEMAPEIGEAEERISSALDYLADQQLIELKPSYARKEYRILRQPDDLPGLIHKMQRSFIDKEARDQGRIDQIFEFISYRKCKAQYLLHYFGEAMEQGCGRCGPCYNEVQVPLEPLKTSQLSGVHLQKIAELKALNLAEVSSPRKIARYLIGISSPAARSARKSHGSLFGCMEDASFKAVMECATHGTH